MQLTGDTVKLHVEFNDFDGNLIDPTQITLKIYDINQTLISGPTEINATDKISTGIYEHNYIIPDQQTTIYYEFTGNPSGLQAVARGVINCGWI